jgi:thiol-disulfide isomerase/thioredoxin
MRSALLLAACVLLTGAVEQVSSSKVTLSDLKAFYEKHDPAKLEKAEKILQQYSSEELVASLTKKYGASPGSGEAPTAAKAADPEVRKISNAKKKFASINQGTSLTWPSDEIKDKAGKAGWGDWEPADGMEGEVVHSWGAKHLLKIGENYCVIHEDGLEGSPRPQPKTEPKKKQKKAKTPEIRKVSNAKKVFSGINEGTSLDWAKPGDAIKAKAGKAGWGDWAPAAGMQGEVVHSWGATKHLLKVDDHFFVIHEDGLEGSPRPPKKKKAKKKAAAEPPKEEELFVLPAAISPLDFPADSAVEELAGWRAEHPAFFAMFYAPWCGHCKSFKPEYAKAAELLAADAEMEEGAVALAAVDCTTPGGRAICGKFNVTGCELPPSLPGAHPAAFTSVPLTCLTCCTLQNLLLPARRCRFCRSNDQVLQDSGRRG